MIINRKNIVSILILGVVIIIIAIKVYIYFFETNFRDLNLSNIKQVKNLLGNKAKYSFVVLGDIQNSIDIFDKKIMPKVQKEGIDFIILSGNFLIDGNNDKYIAFYKSIKKSKIPIIATIGENEVTDGGDERFYKYFGPYYFSFYTQDSYFIFLDSTGKTSLQLQENWLIDQFQQAKNYKHKFVFLNSFEFENVNDQQKKLFTQNLQTIFSQNHVEAVFTTKQNQQLNLANLNFQYFASDSKLAFGKVDSNYDYIVANIDQNAIFKTESLKQDKSQSIFSFLQYPWFQLHAWIYSAYLNLILEVFIVIFILQVLYLKFTKKINYYPKTKNHKTIQKKLTIVMFSNNYLPFIGGVSISLARIKASLEKLGHKVYIFAPEYFKNTKNDSSVIRCRPLFYYRKDKFVFPIVNIFSSKIKRKFNQINPDIVHLHHPFWLGNVGLSLAKNLQIPVVYTHHTRIEKYNSYIPIFKKFVEGQIPQIIIKRFANECDAIIAPTKSTKEYLRNLGVGKIIRTIPTGINLNEYKLNSEKIVTLKKLEKKYQKNKNFILFSAFRLGNEKNPYFLLNGIKMIKKRSKIKFKCLIAGSGPEQANLEKFVIDNNLQNEIEFLGEIAPKSMSLYYQLADIFIFSSKSETQGMVLLEAMAGATPVVAINASGIDDLVINGKNGFKTSDSLENWTDKIIDLMQHKQKLAKMAKYAQAFAENYSMDKVALKLLKLYKKVLIS